MAPLFFCDNVEVGGRLVSPAPVCLGFDSHPPGLRLRESYGPGNAGSNPARHVTDFREPIDLTPTKAYEFACLSCEFGDQWVSHPPL